MTNEYKTICDTCYQKTWYETEQPCKQTLWKGCPSCSSHEYIDEQVPCTGTLKVIDYSELDPRFAQYYTSGERVEVTYKWGETERFYVGMSTGWKPCYIAIKQRNSRGGGVILTKSVKSLRPAGNSRLQTA